MGKKIEKLLEELVADQKKKLLDHARRIHPNLTEEDILQPNDFPELENHPCFRYEEGILDGLRVAKTAIQALERDLKEKK